MAPRKPAEPPVPVKEHHPLEIILEEVVAQAVEGKGVRHGGGSTPFYDQLWVRTANAHGFGFLTGQAAKKLEEAQAKENLEDWEREMLGAIVYMSMAILFRRGLPET